MLCLVTIQKYSKTLTLLMKFKYALYWSKTTYDFLGNRSVLILPDLLRGWACEVEVPAAFVGDEYPELALLTFNLGLEDIGCWEGGAGGEVADGVLGSLTLTLKFLSVRDSITVDWDGGGMGWADTWDWEAGVSWGGGMSWEEAVGWEEAMGWPVALGWAVLDFF